MDKDIYGKQINEQLLNDQSGYKVPQSVATKNNDNNVIDYRNIFLTMTGEISSDYIHRNDLTQKKRPNNVSFMEDTIDNDEQFISNMKKIIDKNYNMYNKENCSIRNLQSRLMKKRGAFSDEDQNLMKRFKKSMDESKTVSVIPQHLQQSVTITPISNHNYSVRTSIPQITSTFASNNINKSLRNNTNQLLFHVTSKLQKNDQIPETTTTITEKKIKQLVCYEMQYFTPSQKDN